MARRRFRSSIALPWERRSVWVRDLLSGRRWKLLVGAALLTLMVAGMAASAAQRRRVHDTRAARTAIKRALDAFRADMGRCPHTMSELLHPPRSGRIYMRQLPVDGWSNPLRVTCPGRHDPDGADVVSAGPSGSFLVDDNIQ